MKLDSSPDKPTKQHRELISKYGRTQLNKLPNPEIVEKKKQLVLKELKEMQQKIDRALTPRLKHSNSQNVINKQDYEAQRSPMAGKIYRMQAINQKYHGKNKDQPIKVVYLPNKTQPLPPDLKKKNHSVELPSNQQQLERYAVNKFTNPMKPDRQLLRTPPKNSISLIIAFLNNEAPSKTLNISCKSTIKQLKAWYTQEHSKIDPESIVLRYMGNLLEDSQTLEQSKITHNSTLQASISEQKGIGIILPDKKTISYMIKIGETVKDIKENVAKFHRIQTKDFSLVYKNKRISDKTTYDQFKFPKGTIFEFVYIKMEVSIFAMSQFGGEILNAIDMQVSCSTSIMHIKKNLNNKWGIPPNLQKIALNKDVLPDELAIGDITPNNQCTLNLLMDLTKYRPLCIRNTHRKQIPVLAFPNNTIRDLINAVEKTPPNCELYLMFQKSQLDQNKKFFECPIPTFEVLTINQRANSKNIELNCKTLSGKATLVLVKTSATIAEVKKKIFEISNYPVSLQVLKLKQVELADFKKVLDYKLTHGSEIHIRLKLRPA